MITNNLSGKSHPSRILIEFAAPEGKQSGLVSDSVIATDNLATLHEKFIDKKLGNLPDLKAVGKTLSSHIRIDSQRLIFRNR